MFINECFLTLDTCDSKATVCHQIRWLWPWQGRESRLHFFWDLSMRFPLCCGSYLQKRSNPVKRTHFLICLWGHFSYLDNSSHSDVTRGSRWTNGLFCDAPGPPCTQPGGLSGALAGIHSWNSLCTLYPAVQRLTNSKDEVRPVFHGFIKKRKEEFTSDCAQL